MVLSLASALGELGTIIKGIEEVMTLSAELPIVLDVVTAAYKFFAQWSSEDDAEKLAAVEAVIDTLENDAAKLGIKGLPDRAKLKSIAEQTFGLLGAVKLVQGAVNAAAPTTSAPIPGHNDLPPITDASQAKL